MGNPGIPAGGHRREWKLRPGGKSERDEDGGEDERCRVVCAFAKVCGVRVSTDQLHLDDTWTVCMNSVMRGGDERG